MHGERTLRIGFVGVGYMGQAAHLRNYATLPGCTVVAIAELRPELGRQVAARYGVAHVYGSAEELLANEQLDGIVASQQYSRHGQVIPPLYAAGTSWHMLGYHKRSDPAAVYARREIERLKASGELGALRYVRILMPAGDWVGGGDFDLIRSDEPLPASAADPPPGDLDTEAFQ